MNRVDKQFDLIKNKLTDHQRTHFLIFLNSLKTIKLIFITFSFLFIFIALTFYTFFIYFFYKSLIELAYLSAIPMFIFCLGTYLFLLAGYNSENRNLKLMKERIKELKLK